MKNISKWWKSLLVLSILVALFNVAVFRTSAASNILKGPYLLFNGGNTSMSVLWQTSANDSNVIRWGTDKSYGMGEETVPVNRDDRQHRFDITGLQPGTLYYYQVDDQSGSFRTAPADNATSVKFLSYGDSRTNPSNQDKVATRARLDYQADPDYQTILLNSGDFAAQDTESDWTSQYFVDGTTYPEMHAFQAEVPMVGARGNHENTGSVYNKYYPYPYVADNYWSFDYGPVHIAIVDEYAPFAKDTAQYKWLENDLATSTKPWKIVQGHQPGWGAGTHANNTDVQSSIHPLLQKYGVQMYLNGHNHNYARAEVDGIEYVTAGGGGAPLYTPNPNAENIVTTDMSYHLAEFDIEGETLTMTARRADGTVIETININQKLPDISKLTLAADGDTLQTDSPQSSVKLGLTAVDSQDAPVDLTDVNVKYKTDKPDILSIAEDGTVTIKNKPVFNESVKVWAQFLNVKSNELTLKVQNPDGLAEAKLTSDSDSLNAGSQAKLSLSLKDNLQADIDPTGADVVYRTSNDDVLAISADGIVTVRNQTPRVTNVSIWAEATVQGRTVESNKVSIIVGVTSGGASHEIIAPIKGVYDTTEEHADGTLDLGSPHLEIVNNQQIILRFDKLALPKGAKILDAYVQFSAADPTANVDPFDVNIYAEAIANSLLEDPGDVSSRVKTNDFVNWKDAPAWTVEHEAGPAQQTPNVASLVQEIVNMEGWKEGNALSFILTGQGSRSAESFYGAGSHADQIPQLHVIYSNPESVPTDPGDGEGTNEIVAPIKNAMDDMEELEDGSMDSGSSDLEIVMEDNTQQIGLRFADLAIPKGATVQDAYIQFSVDEPDKNLDPFDVNIYAEDVSNSASVANVTYNISSRVKTASSINWKDVPLWTVEHEAGPNQQTPNLASLVQGIINKGEWNEGNAMTFILNGQGTRTAEAFEGAGSHADQIPQLHVTYTVPANPGNGGGTPTNPDNGGGNTNPDNGGGNTNPDNGGGNTNPDNGGGNTNPDNGGGNTNPDNGGGNTNPDNGGGNTNPSNGSGTTNPGNGSGTTNPGNGGNPVIPAIPFKDVDSHYDWAKDAIAVLADQGIINGTSATSFEPSNRITRADFMMMLVRMLDLNADVTSNFSDVSANAYYYKALGIVKTLGIANGAGGNKFNPGEFISRQDMMVLMSRAMDVTGKLDLSGTPSDLSGFKDKAKLAPYANDAAAKMVKAGIVQGSGSALNPTGQVTRAETAVMIYRLYLML